MVRGPTGGSRSGAEDDAGRDRGVCEPIEHSGRRTRLRQRAAVRKVPVECARSKYVVFEKAV